MKARDGVIRCSGCGAEHSRHGQRHCVDCHNAYMRAWRQTHPPTPEQRLKSNARRYAGIYVQRGKIERKPCDCCGDPSSQMHHPDYSRPLLVIWLCRICHMALHVLERAA